MPHPTRLFFKNFIAHLLTISIPVIILGTLVLNLTYYYIYDNTTSSSVRSLEQVQQSMEQITTTSTTIENTFNPDAFSGLSLRSILKKKTYDYGEAISLPFFSSTLNALVNSNDFVESAYIYWPNDNDRLLVSNRGITDFQQMADLAWMTSYENYCQDLSRPLDVHLRTMPVSSQPGHPVITLYQKIITLDYQYSKGVAIINLKPEILRESLKKQCIYENQQIYLFNENGERLVGTTILDSSHENLLKKFINTETFQTSGTNSAVHKSQDGYTISILKDADYPFTYASMIPNRQLYAVPRKLLGITCGLVCLSLVLSLTLAALHSRKTSRSIHAIMDIFDAAQNGRPLPQAVSTGDEYGYILTNLISTFIQQEYLSMQLSEKMYRARTLELVALQSQINPHFLFNTLETIHLKSFSLTGQSNDVTYLIENLSSIMRYALSDPNQQVSFADEISYTKAYLNIQKFRYKEKFRVIWEYDEDVLPIPVIKLLIQPLIENAIYHGIKEAPGECALKIKAYLKRNRFYLHIIDSGVGMKPEVLERLRESLTREDNPYEHIGLSNTWKRLNLTYREDSFIRIQSKYGRGTAITLGFSASENMGADMKRV